MNNKAIKKAEKVFHGLSDEDKKIALLYLENRLLGKTKENEMIRKRLGLQTTAD